MTEAVFDTSVIIDHLRGGIDSATELVSKVTDGRMTGYISTLTEAELFAGKDTEDKSKREMLAELLERFSRIEVTSNIARTAGDIRRKYGGLLDDAIIAATAANLNCRLFTKNIKDFKHIKEITVEDPY